MLDESGISDTLEDVFSDVDPEDIFSLFGDPAYPLKLYLLTRLRGIDEDRATSNVFCLSVREFVEWNFGDAVHYWAVIDLKKTLARDRTLNRLTEPKLATSHEHKWQPHRPHGLQTPHFQQHTGT